MGFEKSHIFGKVEVDIRASVAGTIVFQTETPGSALVNRFSMPIPVCTRTIIKSRLPGIMQGHYVKASGTPGTTPSTGHWELYGVRIWQRELPDGQWAWFPLPVMDTPVEFMPFKIPGLGGSGEESTAEEYSEFTIPVEETPKMFAELKVPVEPTEVSFNVIKAPVEPTGETFSALKVPLDSTPTEYIAFKAPVEATPASYDAFKVPVKPTPVVPEWLSIPIDE